MWHLFSDETKVVSPLSLPLNLLSPTPSPFVFSLYLCCIHLFLLDFYSQIHDHRYQQQKGKTFMCSFFVLDDLRVLFFFCDFFLFLLG